MENNLEQTFVDVRRAFRLIYQLQTRIRDIVFYIKEQTPYESCVGIKRFSNEINNRKHALDNYAKLKVFKDMWGWDFIYGYLFEFYLGNLEIGKKWTSMSIIQVSDDGFAISNNENKRETKISTFESPEDSHSCLLFVFATADKPENFIWLGSNTDIEEQQYINEFLASNSDNRIEDGEKGAVFIIKKYQMERFSSQTETDMVLRDFSELVDKKCNIRILK